MKVLIIGTGAVGLSLASALCRTGADTHVVARGATAKAIRKYGIERRGILGHVVVSPENIRVFESVQEAETGYDFIINSAKTTANADIARDLAGKGQELLSAQGILVLAQNGFGNERAFTEVLAIHRIYHASFAIGFLRPQPHISEVTVFSAPVSVGSIFGDPAKRCAELVGAIDRGGIPSVVTNEIAKTMWAKLLYNCTLNPLSAILKTNYGGLTKSESTITLMKHVIEEIFAVMHAAGYETQWNDAQAYQKEFFEKILPPTYGHRSSTLQDIERKIPTEIDSLNGAVVSLGQRFGIETPCNAVITQILKGLESLY